MMRVCVSRFRFVVAQIGCLLALASLSASATGQERPAKVGLDTATCSPSDLDVDALAAAVRLELSSVLGGVPTLTPSPEPTDLRISVDCTAAGSMKLTVSRPSIAATESETFSTGDLDPAMRPRTVALAAAELARRVLGRPAPAPPRPKPEIATPAAAPAAALGQPSADVRARRLRLDRNLAVSFGALTFATGVIGGSLLGAGESGTANPIPGLVAPGASLLALGGASLIATVVTFSLWMRERGRSAPAD
jgi:hypothetical protein